jgi:hypothetical protein
MQKALDEATIPLANGNTTLLKKKNLTLGKNPGREVLMRFGDCVHARTRIFVAQSRIYLVGLEGLHEQVTGPEADSFFNSFRLTGPIPAPVPPKPPVLRLFTSKEGGFSVLLPGTPEVKHSVHDSPIGQMKLRQFGLEAANRYWFVQEIELPFAPPDQRQCPFSSIANDLAAKMKGWVVCEKVLSGREPGREVLIWVSDSFHVRGRFYLANEKVFGLCVAGTPGELKSPEVERFFESFKLMK